MEETRPRARSVSVRVRRSSTSAAKAFQGLTPIAGAADGAGSSRLLAPSAAEPARRTRGRTLTVTERLQLRDVTEEERQPLAAEDLDAHHDDAEVELVRLSLQAAQLYGAEISSHERSC